MSANFDLIITADDSSRTVGFRLLDGCGALLALRQTDFNLITVSRQQGLFDLRNYVRIYVDEGKEDSAVSEIGVCIAEEVLGKEIFLKLWQPVSQRTLRIQLPGASEGGNIFASALARIPWEIARPSAKHPTLGERNVAVRVVHDIEAPPSSPLELAADEPLRVLFVFAESRGSRPLGARKERRELMQLFEKEIYPNRRVVAHFVTHGVTRERLRSQIKENGGYHIVHWSGHGHTNLLELSQPSGARDQLSGEDLLGIFADAGGFLPRLFFLSACHSGDILRVNDWQEFISAAQGNESDTKAIACKDIEIEIQPGYTGTAHALLQGGVPSVVAMRYAVGDDYARELAVEFFRALLAHSLPKSAAAALALARRAVLDGKKHHLARFAICDHATPVLYGSEQPDLALVQGRSPAANRRDPRLHQITDLVTPGHVPFVGRTWELAGIASDFIGLSAGAEVKPAAVITGLGGMGKTALAAEVLALWEAHFQWVLLYQGKLSPLGFDATLRDIHIKLMGELGRYHDHVRVNPADAISREPNVGFAGPERLERLTRNLIRAMKDEPILLVLDNFETNLKQQAEPRSGGDLTAESRNLVWACQDSEWDYCLAILAKELIGSQSRVLVTCRRPIAALADGVAHQVLLGPLPPAEAAFFLKEHPALSRMVFAADHAEKDIALRLLNASRFHPLLMDRLARLAEDVNMRSQLITLIEGLEAKNSFAKLSSLFDASPGDAKELAYLNEALASSLDQIILNTNPDARKLLWMIGVADATVARDILEAAWYHLVWNRVLHDSATSSPLEDYKDRQGDLLSSLVKKRIKELLSQISSVGLVSEQCFAPGHASSVFSCHEIVRERICIWMDQHSDEKGTLSEEDVWLAYAEQLELDFQSLHAQNVESALRVGNQAITYLVRAGAWAKLGDFANTVITCTRDPHLLENLIPFMQTSAESAPQGASRWRCIHSLANILRNIGRPDCSLPLYEQAARLARNNLGAENSESQRTWEDISKISSGWAISLRRAGHIEDARQRYIESIEACQKANRPIIHCLSHELEILRLDIIAGKAATAAPEVEERLVKMRDWWKRHLAGESLTEAPDADFLARALIGALDVATEVASDMKDMESAIRRTEETLEIRYILKHSEMEIAIDRFNLAKKLTHIPSRYGEARMELEDCLRIFKSRPDWTAKVLCCLADLFGRQGDITEAITQQRRALAICQGLPDPSDCGHSHDSLASFLKRLNIPSAASEAKFHQLAAMIYFLVASIERRLQASLNDYRDDFCHAHTDGTVLAVPKVADVLADTSFHTLRQWLIQRQVDMDELQSTVDHLLDLVRQEALSQP